MAPVIGEIGFVTDGEKSGEDGYFVEFGPGKQWVQIDLKESAALQAILVWHYHSQARVYRDVVVQVSDDKDFVDGRHDRLQQRPRQHLRTRDRARTRNTSRPTRAGSSTPRATKARYVRLYSRAATPRTT